MSDELSNTNMGGGLQGFKEMLKIFIKPDGENQTRRSNQNYVCGLKIIVSDKSPPPLQSPNSPSVQCAALNLASSLIIYLITLIADNIILQLQTSLGICSLSALRHTSFRSFKFICLEHLFFLTFYFIRLGPPSPSSYPYYLIRLGYFRFLRLKYHFLPPI